MQWTRDEESASSWDRHGFEVRREPSGTRIVVKSQQRDLAPILLVLGLPAWLGFGLMSSADAHVVRGDPRVAVFMLVAWSLATPALAAMLAFNKTLIELRPSGWTRTRSFLGGLQSKPRSETETFVCEVIRGQHTRGFLVVARLGADSLRLIEMTREEDAKALIRALEESVLACPREAAEPKRRTKPLRAS